MSKKANRLQEKLERLEAGEPLATCQTDLPDDEAALLELASHLGTLQLPERDPKIASEQRHRLLKLAAKEQPSQHQTLPPRSLLQRLTPATAISGALTLLLLCAVVALMGGRAAWRGLFEAPTLEPSSAVSISKVEATPTATNPPAPAPTETAPPTATPTATEDGPTHISPLPTPTAQATAAHEVYLPMAIRPLSSQSARLEDIRGVAEVQTDNGRWRVADDSQIVKTGQRLRTGHLSGATLRFYDGSTARLGPNTEISIDELDRASDGSRIVALTQWRGESDHDVAPTHSEMARYEVHTPTGSGEAKGTRFHVTVTPALVAHFYVDEGAIAVTHLNVTVIVMAGQLTIIEADQPPSEPLFHITGEGRVTQKGSTWTIGGQNFETRQDTIIIGDPQLNDWVSVKGHLKPDGTRIADQIILLYRWPENRFTITGQVEAIAESVWIVAGQTIAIDKDTEIGADIAIDDVARVEGIILEDGTLLARQIRRLDLEPGLPFRFVGVVQGIADDVWTISGLSIAIDQDTTLDDDLAVGDLVEVEGWLLEDGTRLAHAIRRLEDPKATFEFSGFVESLEPWIVSGITFETRAWTEIEAGIEIGDAVKVEGRILENGTWLASEVKLLQDKERLGVEFVGRVESIDPWIVAGVSLPVDAQTEIVGPVEVGTLVKVEAEILPDGTWIVIEIKFIEAQWEAGCMRFTAIVLRIKGEQIVLQDGTILPFDPSIPVHGNLQADSVILIYFCVDIDGNITIYSIIILHEPAPTPSPTPTHSPPPPIQPPPSPTQPPPPGDGNPIVINGNNQTLTFTCSGNSVTINGNANTITLTGSCGPVTVRGNSNWVSIQSTTLVTNTGNDNTIVGP